MPLQDLYILTRKGRLVLNCKKLEVSKNMQAKFLHHSYKIQQNVRLMVLFLQDLQDLVPNLASSALKMNLFLQDMKILQESCNKNCKIVFLQDLIKTLQENYLTKFSCKILVKFYFARKACF